MSNPVTLDPRQERPLTSREIAKILGSILAGVLVSAPHAADSMGTAFEHIKWIRVVIGIGSSEEMTANARTLSLDEAVQRANALVAADLHREGKATWFTALTATISGFYGWCRAEDVDTAVAWCQQNWREHMPTRGRTAPHFPD